jgi:hypothetical protein
MNAEDAASGMEDKAKRKDLCGAAEGRSKKASRTWSSL